MPKEKRYFVYLLTNWNNEVMYVGVTNDLDRRVYEHKNKLVKGFTEKYNVNKLVYFEETGDVTVALAREKEIKKWRREKKNGLVLSINPDWKDLSERAKDFSHSFEMTDKDLRVMEGFFGEYRLITRILFPSPIFGLE